MEKLLDKELFDYLNGAVQVNRGDGFQAAKLYIGEVEVRTFNDILAAQKEAFLKRLLED